MPVGIFSSGSVLAQQLLFGHSSAGDLTPFLRWYFDTRVGAKVEPDSYRTIAQTIGFPANSILFVSDVTRELTAARAKEPRDDFTSDLLLARDGDQPASGRRPDGETGHSPDAADVSLRIDYRIGGDTA